MLTHAPAAKPEDLVRVLRAAGIHDPRLLKVFRRVRREAFVAPEWRRRAYQDAPLPIAHGLVTTQPSLLALMVQALELQGNERVLEIGTGLGFQTAILASLCRQVLSVEWFSDLAEQARANLEAAGIRNARVFVGDGSRGLPQHEPYHGIVVAAAAPRIAPPLAAQLAEGGRLVQPLGPGGDERVVAVAKRAERLVEESLLTSARFVPLRGAFGTR